MNPEIKKRWIDALTSEEYVQGKGFLCDRNDRFCCLGVLCDLYVKDGLGSWKVCVVWNEIDGRCYDLPLTVQVWAGLDDSNTVVEIGKTLSKLNDISCLNFKQIAEHIERAL